MILFFNLKKKLDLREEYRPKKLWRALFVLLNPFSLGVGLINNKKTEECSETHILEATVKKK